MQIPKERGKKTAYLAFVSLIVLSPTLTWLSGLLHTIALCPASFIEKEQVYNTRRYFGIAPAVYWFAQMWVSIRREKHSARVPVRCCAPGWLCHQLCPAYILRTHWRAAAKAPALSFHPLAKCTCCPEPSLRSCQSRLLLLFCYFLSCLKRVTHSFSSGGKNI